MAANFNQNIVAVFQSAAIGNDDFTMIRAATVADVWAIANGAAAGNCTLQSTAAAISSTLNVNAGSGTIARSTTLAAAGVLAVGAILRVVKTAAVSTTTCAYLSATGVTTS